MGDNLLAFAITVGYASLSFALLLGFIRLMIGPSLADRVVALDMIALIAIAYAALYAIASDDQAFLDVSIVLALVAFLTTVAFARFAERRKFSRIDKARGEERSRA
ncbi:MAG: hypothetical protein HC850_01270 [Rhodomicrobium sp.]|nr:hypothetical protein [Rhodomicrobium sp.]